ncbi:MAG: chromosome segregation protein, partial [Verrucomicrobiales bacterium]|nr:chromosome segregation protein [Verrucomicrobiales bacterium]
MATPLLAASVDYSREVKPILAENCYKCHGAAQRKGGLRLDTAALAVKGGERGAAIKPGKSAESPLIQAIKGTHPELPRMPHKRPPLTDTQIASIEQWVEQG